MKRDDTSGDLTRSEIAIAQLLANGAHLADIAKKEGYASKQSVHQKLYRLKLRIEAATLCAVVAHAFRRGMIK